MTAREGQRAWGNEALRLGGGGGVSLNSLHDVDWLHSKSMRLSKIL